MSTIYTDFKLGSSFVGSFDLGEVEARIIANLSSTRLTAPPESFGSDESSVKSNRINRLSGRMANKLNEPVDYSKLEKMIEEATMNFRKKHGWPVEKDENGKIVVQEYKLQSRKIDLGD